MKPSWYINRLKTMSFPELMYRAKQIAKHRYYKVFEKGKKVSSIPFKGTKHILDSEGINKALENFTFNPEFRIFDRSMNLYEIPDWHTDINSGEKFPSTSYARDINTRTHPNRSAKFTWEINRLQYLTYIAYAFRNTNDNKYLELFKNHIDSWIDNNPYMTGVNWYSNIELNVRLISWFLCWEIMDLDTYIANNPEFKIFVESKWLPVIYQHCKHTSHNFSHFSSSNNHLISEYAGLFVASSFWNFQKSSKWQKLSKKGLETEIIKQHTSEGINKEETSEYIQFITDYFLVTYVVAEKSGNNFSESYKNKLKQIFEYINTMLDSGCHLPKYGDEDDGRTFILELEPDFNNFKSILQSGVVIFGVPEWKNRLGDLDIKNSVLFGIEGLTKYNVVKAEPISAKSKFYADSGHFFMKKVDQRGEVYIHFNAAPLGFLSIAAHGHADALSFLLHLDGQPFLVDPGTYTYHTEKEYRDYFKGTLAHNTICINHANQSVIGGPTMWREHYSVDIHSYSSNNNTDQVEASHNGYVQNHKLLHTRSMEFDKNKLVLTINDNISASEANGSYHMEFPLHIHPDIKVEKVNANNFILSSEKTSRVIKLTTDPRFKYSLISGSTSPILGWYSKSFNIKTPSPTLYGEATAEGNSKITTTITIE